MPNRVIHAAECRCERCDPDGARRLSWLDWAFVAVTGLLFVTAAYAAAREFAAVLFTHC